MKDWVICGACPEGIEIIDGRFIPWSDIPSAHTHWAPLIEICIEWRADKVWTTKGYPIKRLMTMPLEALTGGKVIEMIRPGGALRIGTDASWVAIPPVWKVAEHELAAAYRDAGRVRESTPPAPWAREPNTKEGNGRATQDMGAWRSCRTCLHFSRSKPRGPGFCKALSVYAFPASGTGCLNYELDCSRIIPPWETY